MTKHIPYEKLSKKKRRELDLRRRGTWQGLNPVTRRPENPRAYNRKKLRAKKEDAFDPELFSLFSNKPHFQRINLIEFLQISLFLLLFQALPYMIKGKDQAEHSAALGIKKKKFDLKIK